MIPVTSGLRDKRKHFTATCYVLQNKMILFIYHNKFKKWLPPGGHLEADETPPEAAKREVLEETGLKIELIPQENLKIEFEHAKSIVRPYLCLTEKVPAYDDEVEHEHIDMIFLGYPVGGTLLPEARWFSLQEIQTLEKELKIFSDVKVISKHIYEVFMSDSSLLR